MFLPLSEGSPGLLFRDVKDISHDPYAWGTRRSTSFWRLVMGAVAPAAGTYSSADDTEHKNNCGEIAEHTQDSGEDLDFPNLYEFPITLP
jgi:hypothetical protein